MGNGPVAESQLPVRIVAKRIQMALLGQGQRMAGSRGNAYDHGLGERLEDSRRRLKLFVIATAPALSEIVSAPTEDLAFVGYDEIVVAAARGADDALRLQRRHQLWDPLLLFVPQLAVLVGSACVDGAIVEKEERVIEAATSGHQLLGRVVEERQRLGPLRWRIATANS